MRHFIDICGVVDSVFGVIDSVFGVIDSVFGVVSSVFGVVGSVFGVVDSVFGVVGNVFGVVGNIFGVVDDLARAKTGFPLRAKGRLCSSYKPRVTLNGSEIGLVKEEGVVTLRGLM